MKKISKLLITAAAAMFIAVPFSACERGVDLESPTGFNLDEKYFLTWEPVSNARSYLLEITNVATGKSEESSARRENYLLSYLETGDYEIRVRAVGDGQRYNNSDWSAVLAFNRAYESGSGYKLINNGLEYELTSTASTVTELVMEDTYRGKPVTSIGDNAFSKAYELEKVTISKNVKRIGKAAFYNCISLKSVIIPESVTFIDVSAFQSCMSLESFKMPSGVTAISDSTFSYCRALKEFDFNNVTEIGASAFAGCGSFTHFVIPDTITTIGNSAFSAMDYNDKGLKEVTIGSGVTTIGDFAFYQCKNLEKVNFSKSGNLKRIEKAVFANDPKLTSITLPDGLESIGMQAFYGTSELSQIDIPDSVRVIKRNCFDRSKLYEDAKEAGEHLVYADKWLVSRVNQDDGYEIKQLYGSNPEELENTELFREDTVGIADFTFRNNEDIEDVKLPRNLKYLGASAFSLCKNLYRFDASDSLLEVVDVAALSYCSGLLSIYFNHVTPRLKEIGFMAFYDCEQLSYNSSIGGKLIPESVESIGSLAFEKTKMYDDADKFGVVYADDWVISCINKEEDTGIWGSASKKAASDIDLRDGTRGIADYAFAYCRSLKTISNTANIEIFGRGAFYECRRLMGVNLNTNITKIDDYTFYECWNLVITRFPTALREIGRSAFYGCSSLEEIDLVQPAFLESVGAYAFYGCYNATSLEIGSGLSEIEEYTFYGCRSLQSVTIPSNIKTIGKSAFSNCVGLEELIFEEGVESIDAYGFNKNRSLKAINLPDSLKTIGNNAFFGCEKVTSINLNQVEYIGDYAFAMNFSVGQIVIPESVKSIGIGAFYAVGAQAVDSDRVPLGGVRSVIVSAGIERMDAHAFYGCNVATFYIEGENKSEEWGSSWNSFRRPVVWGVTLSEDRTYVVSFTVQKNTFEYYKTLNAPSAPYREGYTFLGWSLSPTSGEIAYTVQDVMTAPVGTTLYAVYMQK